MLLITPDGTNINMEDERLINLIKILGYLDNPNELHGLILAIYSGLDEYYLDMKEVNALFKAMYMESMGGI